MIRQPPPPHPLAEFIRFEKRTQKPLPLTEGETMTLAKPIQTMSQKDVAMLTVWMKDNANLITGKNVTQIANLAEPVIEKRPSSGSIKNAAAALGIELKKASWSPTDDENRKTAKLAEENAAKFEWLRLRTDKLDDMIRAVALIAELAADKVTVSITPGYEGQPPNVILDPNTSDSKKYYRELARLRYALQNVLGQLDSKDTEPRYPYWTTQGNGKNGHMEGHGQRPDK